MGSCALQVQRQQAAQDLFFVLEDVMFPAVDKKALELDSLRAYALRTLHCVRRDQFLSYITLSFLLESCHLRSFRRITHYGNGRRTFL